MYTNKAGRRERILTTKPGSSQLPEPWPSPCPRLRGRGSCDVASGCAVAPPLAPRRGLRAGGGRRERQAAGHVRTRAAWVGTGSRAPEVGVTVPGSVLDGTAEWLRWARGRGGSRARVRRHLRPGAGGLAGGRRAVPGPPQATADSAGAGRRGRDRRGTWDPGGAGCAWCPRCPRRPLLSPRVAPARPAPARGFPGGSGRRAASRAVGGLRLRTGRTRDAAEPRSWPRAGGLPAATC